MINNKSLIMKYTARLQALEPKRWWHFLGIKRKYVDFNIDFSVIPNSDIKLIATKNTTIVLDELIVNGDFETSSDWTKGDGWNVKSDNDT